LIESVINHAVQTHKWEFQLKFFKTALICAGLILLQGCATQFMAMGEWAEPSDLHLNEHSLSGVKVSVRCSHMDKAGTITPQSYPICPGLARHLIGLGAEALANDQPGANLTVWYIEEGVVDKQISAGSVAGLIFTAGIVPMVSSATSRVELRITDSRGVVLERHQLTASKVRVFGWSAWFALGKKARQKELGQKFYQFVKNRVVSQAVDQKLAAPAKDEEGPSDL
jgi:hypothetical protein